MLTIVLLYIEDLLAATLRQITKFFCFDEAICFVKVLKADSSLSSPAEKNPDLQ